MSKEKQVTIRMSTRSASEIRQILFEHQKGYSYEFVPERIVNVRDVINQIDNQIENFLNN